MPLHVNASIFVCAALSALEHNQGDVMFTYFECMLRCPPVAAHQALLHPLCGWQLVEQPAGGASLPSPVALLVVLAPMQRMHLMIKAEQKQDRMWQ